MNKLFKQAFTLIELLVVIAIIGILSGLIVVSMGGMTTKATIAKAQVFSNSLRNSLMLNLVSEWKFDELTTAVDGTTIKDSWGGLNNGTLDTNSVAADSTDKLKSGTDCVSGKCLFFDGTDDYIEKTSSSNMPIGSSARTITAWVNNGTGSAVNGVKTVVMIGSSSTSSAFNLCISNNRELYLAGWSNDVKNTTNLIPYGTWKFIVMTYNGGGQFVPNTQVRGFIDGTQVSLVNAAGNNSTSLNTTPSQVRIGASFWGSYYFDGLIDDVRIYNAEIPTSQIKEQYYAGLNSLLANGSITKEEYGLRVNSIAQR